MASNELFVRVAAVAVAWLTIACKGETSRTPCFYQSDDGRPFVMAYRGASGEFPEHSVAAYRAAVKQGARFIECDAVLTSDLVPICRHEPNIAETTTVLRDLRRMGLTAPPSSSSSSSSSGGSSGGGASPNQRPTSPQVLASDLTWSQIQQLRAVFPGRVVAPGARAAPSGARAVEQGQEEEEEREEPNGAEGLRVASLEDLLRMASAALPPVGVAVHIQSSVWHNSLPQVRARNTTFEDILLELLQRYDYAAGPYDSPAWRARPSYIMAFEASSLRYLSQRTSSPLTQVLGPTIPDTGETWDSATGSGGLARIAAYAGSVAVARQQLLGEAPASGAAPGGGGGSGGGLVAREPLIRMRRAGLQVFASVFKPRPAEHLLPGAVSWEDEVAPLLLGTGLPDVHGGVDGEGSRHSALDGFFSDSPAELHLLFLKFRCGAVQSRKDEL